MLKKVLGNERGDFNLQYAVIVGLTVVALVVVIAIGTLILGKLNAVQNAIEGGDLTYPSTRVNEVQPEETQLFYL